MQGGCYRLKCLHFIAKVDTFAQDCSWALRVLIQADTRMLVLSRKIGDRILIGDDITITVVKVGGGSVRIGIDAPPHLPVVRKELNEQIEEEQAEQKELSASESAS